MVSFSTRKNRAILAHVFFFFMVCSLCFNLLFFVTLFVCTTVSAVVSGAARTAIMWRKQEKLEMREKKGVEDGKEVRTVFVFHLAS